jgi:hypothetical protein
MSRVLRNSPSIGLCIGASYCVRNASCQQCVRPRTPFHLRSDQVEVPGSSARVPLFPYMAIDMRHGRHCVSSIVGGDRVDKLRD